MADEYLLNYLRSTLNDPQGRKKWLVLKLRTGRADLSSESFTELSLKAYDFSECNFSTSVMLAAELAGSDFSDARLDMVDLRRSDLTGCCFDRANLNHANLQGAKLADAGLDAANLQGAKLNGADLIGADLSNADLRGADFRGASLRYTSLVGAKLDGADVADCDMTGSVLDDEAPHYLKNFDQAHIDDRDYRMMKCRLARGGGALPEEETQKLGADATNGKAENESRGLIRFTGKRATPKRRAEDKGLTGPAPSKFRGRKRRASDFARIEPESYVATQEDLESEAGLYRILGVEYGTPITGITKAFRKRAKQLHPDKVRHLGAEQQLRMTEQFHLLRQAYELIMKQLTKPLSKIHWPEGINRRASPFEYSIEEYELLFDANPENADVLYNLAWKYFDAGDMDLAIQTYERVLELDPKDDDAQYNLRVVKICKTFDLPPETAFV